MILRFYDEDTMIDEIIGSIDFDLKELIVQPNLAKGYYSWFNITGGPKDFNNNAGTLMNF